MCLAIVGKIEEIHNSYADVNILGVKTVINISLVDDPKVNDYVLIHTGYAIEKVSDDRAVSIEKILMDMLRDDENE